MRKIVVLGSGFAGYNAALQLEEGLAGRRRTQLTVVSDTAHFLFTPLLYSVATGELDMTHITVDLKEHFKATTNLVIDTIDRLDLERRVLIGQQGEIPFDYLIIAPGSVVDWGEIGEKQGWSNFAHTFKDARDGVRLREVVQNAFVQAEQLPEIEDVRKKVTFVVIGAGATGVELAAELYTAIAADTLPLASERVREQFRFVLVESNSQTLTNLPDELRATAQPYLENVGLEIHLGNPVVEMTAQSVTLENGERIEADNLIWCGGVRAPHFLAKSGFQTDPQTGRVLVEETLRVPDHNGIYVIGDAALTDPALAQNAHVAIQQANLAAQNLLADLVGRATRPLLFEHHGDLVSLGRGNAVVTVRNKVIEGKPAWLMYRLFYTAMMPRALKKARLLKDWVASRANKFEGPKIQPLLGQEPDADTETDTEHAPSQHVDKA